MKARSTQFRQIKWSVMASLVLAAPLGVMYVQGQGKGEVRTLQNEVNTDDFALGHNRRLINTMALGAPVGTVVTGFEGAITAVIPTNVAGGPGILEVMGVRIVVPQNVRISTPTQPRVALADLGRRSLPGRAQRGFLGGTAIVQALSVDGIHTALDIFVEPSENILLGPITANDPATGIFQIMGVDVIKVDEPRVPYFGDYNPFMMFIDLDTVAVGEYAAAEGWFGNDGKFYAFVVQAKGGIRINQGVDIGFGRSDIVDTRRGQLRVRGFASIEVGFVDIYDDDRGTFLGTAPIDPIGADGGAGTVGFGRWRLRVDGVFPPPENVRCVLNGIGPEITGDSGITYNFGGGL